MSNTFEPNKFADTFADLQTTFSNRVEADDRSRMVAGGSHELAATVLARSGRADFTRLDISMYELRTNPELGSIIGRVVLMQNRRLQAFSPAIIMSVSQGYELTMLDQPFDPKVGFTEGQHFGLSAKAQTRTVGFGGHEGAGAFEAGHFGTLLVGAQNTQVGDAIRQYGDRTADAVIGSGIPEAMQQAAMSPITYLTSHLAAADRRKLPIIWHPALDTEAGPASGDYPNAVRLLLGAGAVALGQRGLQNAKLLVDDAVQRWGR